MRDAAAVVGPGNARLCWWTAERIGKSRLVPEIITRLREPGELVLVETWCGAFRRRAPVRHGVLSPIPRRPIDSRCVVTLKPAVICHCGKSDTWFCIIRLIWCGLIGSRDWWDERVARRDSDDVVLRHRGVDASAVADG